MKGRGWMHFSFFYFHLPIDQPLTAIGNVEPSPRHRVIGLKLELQNVAIGCQMGRNFSPREASQYCGSWLIPIFDSKKVVRRLQIKVIEGQMDPGARLRDNQPNAVKVVPVAFWIVWRQHRPHGRSEVRETGNCVTERAKTSVIYPE